MGRVYNEERYQNVLNAACLKSDLEDWTIANNMSLLLHIMSFGQGTYRLESPGTING